MKPAIPAKIYALRRIRRSSLGREGCEISTGPPVLERAKNKELSDAFTDKLRVHPEPETKHGNSIGGSVRLGIALSQGSEFSKFC